MRQPKRRERRVVHRRRERVRDRPSNEPDLRHRYLFPCLLNLGSAETRSGWWIRSSPAGAGAPGREARRSSLISVLDPVRLVLLQGPREGVVPRAVVLRDEVEVRDARRAGRAFERRLSRAADRRRRKSGDLIRVVRRIDLEVLERGLAPLADRVLDGRVGEWREPTLQDLEVDSPYNTYK